jgi:hypothetical protein
MALLDNMTDRNASESPFTTRAPAMGPAKHGLMSRRNLQLTLGGLWLLDGALQLQPFMFTGGFASKVLAPSAAGQPGWVAWSVLRNAHLVGSHPALFNGLFAAIQLLLGAAFLSRRTVRVAIVGSVAWSIGVWSLGEGLGGLAGGTATFLNGAPGAAVLYAVLALAAWPRLDRRNHSRTRGFFVSASVDDGIASWFAGAWAAIWVGLGILSTLPANRNVAAVTGLIHANADQVPMWLARIDFAVASGVKVLGPLAIGLFIVVPIAIGIGGVRSRYRRAAVLGGITFAIVVWAVGQNFGLLFSGSATDPDSAPLLIVANLALLGIHSKASLVRSKRATVHDIHIVESRAAQPAGGQWNECLPGIFSSVVPLEFGRRH